MKYERTLLGQDALLNMCQVSLLLVHFLQRSTNLTKRPVSFPITGTRDLMKISTHVERQ